MANVPLPIPQLYSAHQEDLLWFANLADGALGRRSIQGAIQARLEGRSGVEPGFDILEDINGAFNDVVNRSSFRAAARFKNILAAWRSCTQPSQQRLSAVYWTPIQRGLEAWDRLANMVVLSPKANRRYVDSKLTMSFGEWVMNLSTRKMGIPGKGGVRKPPKATQREMRIVEEIDRECQNLLIEALEEYSLYAQRNDIQEFIHGFNRRHG